LIISGGFSIVDKLIQLKPICALVDRKAKDIRARILHRHVSIIGYLKLLLTSGAFDLFTDNGFILENEVWRLMKRPSDSSDYMEIGDEILEQVDLQSQLWICEPEMRRLIVPVLLRILCQSNCNQNVEYLGEREVQLGGQGLGDRLHDLFQMHCVNTLDGLILFSILKRLSIVT
jgi:hypothetical protein